MVFLILRYPQTDKQADKQAIRNINRTKKVINIPEY